MKLYTTSSFTTVAALAALLAGCSSDGGVLGSSLTTSSVDPAKAAMAAPKIDPACIALTAKIDALRKDGVTGRVEKASAGKTSTVSVKRESLAKMTELDKANADYQTKCSAPGLAKPMAAAPVAPAVPVAAVSTTAPAKAATATVAKKAVAAAAPVAAAPAAAVAPAVAAAVAPAAAVVAPVAAAPVAAPVVPVAAAPVAKP